ncbi:MAG: hypothetical protein LBD31_02940 [Treponema sp.]|jgi:two-component system chemotaxis sensor kinase CheA|nr:hypothetical protein [Treponema sp.]
MALLVIRLLIFASLALSVYIIIVTLERCRSEKRYGFIYCMVTLFLYTLGYFIEMTSTSQAEVVIAVKILYAGGCFMSPFFFFFVADYCEIRIKKRFYRIPMLAVPVLSYAMVLTLERHKLLYAGYFYDPANPIQGMRIEPGPLYMVPTLYSLFCIGLTCIILIRGIARRKRGRFALVLFLVSSLAPLAANFIYIALSFFFTTALSGINFTAFVMVASNFILYYNVLRNDLFDLAPRAYSITLDLIRDAFVVLDWNMAYISSNKNALELFPGLAKFQKGRPVPELEEWPRELARESAEGETRKDIEFTLPRLPGRIYSGWINRIEAENKSALGWVVLVQDVTETVGLLKNIRAQRDEIAAMRDNLKEGIFFMDREFHIQGEYSKALEEVLSSKNLEGKSFAAVLEKSYSPKDIGIIADYFSMIFEGTVDPDMLEDMNPLVEFAYTSAETGAKKTLRGLFAPVDQGDGRRLVLVTLQDISAETALRKRLAEEESRRQDEMRNLFEVMQVDKKVFADFMEDADYEFDRINLSLQDTTRSNRDILVSIYQAVHAVKSNALVAGLSGYGEKLHALESEIRDLREKEEVSFEQMLRITSELEKNRRDRERFREIIRRIADFNAAGGEETKGEEEVFGEILSRACARAAGDMGKQAVFKITAFDREALLHGQRRAMKEILTQLVRNAVCHGIETPEERRAAGKNETGTVQLAVEAGSGRIHMVLSDDGRGLDLDHIARKAKEQGLIKNPGEETDPRFLTGVIFSPGFSTSETENLHAGRGIGLNLVRDRLRELGGKIQIRSEKGRGLTFDMQIPLTGENQ